MLFEKLIFILVKPLLVKKKKRLVVYGDACLSFEISLVYRVSFSTEIKERKKKKERKRKDKRT